MGKGWSTWKERYATDPIFRGRIQRRNRERYRNNQAFRQDQLQKKKDRYASDPAFRLRTKTVAHQRYLRLKGTDDAKKSVDQS